MPSTACTCIAELRPTGIWGAAWHIVVPDEDCTATHVTSEVA